MNSNYTYRQAEEKDIKVLEEEKIAFHYKNNIKAEICGKNSQNFIWIIMEDDGVLCGFTRSKKLTNWWSIEGLYISERVNDIWCAYKITNYTIVKLSSMHIRGILTWTDSTETPKAQIFRRHNFSPYGKRVYRFILFHQSILKLQSLTLSANTNDNWDYANTNQYQKIINLSKNSNSFIENINIDRKNQLTKWFVYNHGSDILAAICWWKHEDLIEIHFTLSKEQGFDCIDGIIKLINLELDKSINQIKINLEYDRFKSLMRILQISPSTYNNGYCITLFKYNI